MVRTRLAASGADDLAFGTQRLSLECAKRQSPTNPRIKESERRGLPEATLEISSHLGNDRTDTVPFLASRAMKVQTDRSDIRRHSAPHRRSSGGFRGDGLNIHIQRKDSTSFFPQRGCAGPEFSFAWRMLNQNAKVSRRRIGFRFPAIGDDLHRTTENGPDPDHKRRGSPGALVRRSDRDTGRPPYFAFT